MRRYRRPSEDAYGDRDDEFVSKAEWFEEIDSRALEPIDILIAAEEAERLADMEQVWTDGRRDVWCCSAPPR